MAQIDQITCLTGVGNTGVVPCSRDFKFPQGMIITPKGAQFDVTANTGNILTTLSANFYAASKSARWYPLYNTLMVADNSDQKQEQTFPKGSSFVVVEKFNKWKLQWFTGGFDLMQALRKFNGANWDFFPIDDDPSGAKILGIIGSTANMLRAIPTDGGRIWTDPWKLNDATKITEYFTEVVYNQKYATDLGHMVQVSFDFPTKLPGLIDATLSSPSANVTSGSFNVAITSVNGQDLAALYSTILNSNTYWTCVNSATQAAITINTVTFVPGIGGAAGYFTIAVTTTAPPYPATSINVNFNLVSASTLAGAGIPIESTGLVGIVKN